MEDKDLSIVIANAGVLQVGNYIDMEPWKIQQILDVNVYHYAMMHKLFLPKLIDRTKENKKCALIGVSSSSWLRVMPSFVTYTGSKAFASYFSIALAVELKNCLTSAKYGNTNSNLIDYHCFVPAGTATNIVDEKF